MLIDIGCNLASSRLLPHVKRILAEAQEAGVIAQIITGSDAASNQTALELANRHSELYATAGYHPHHADDWHAPAHRLLLQTLAREPRCVAVGEMGLDYHRNLARRDNQRRCFADQLAIAKTVQKPVFLHEREAFADFSAILGEALPELAGAVWHCFTGTRAQMETLAERGVYFGITGWICDPVRGAELRDTVRHIPADRLMLETDAPYLTPKTLNPLPRVNEPRYLPAVLHEVARCRDEDPAALAAQTLANTRRFFGVSGCPSPQNKKKACSPKKALAKPSSSASRKWGWMTFPPSRKPMWTTSSPTAPTSPAAPAGETARKPALPSRLPSSGRSGKKRAVDPPGTIQPTTTP